jgi:hypothetical protein
MDCRDPSHRDVKPLSLRYQTTERVGMQLQTVTLSYKIMCRSRDDYLNQGLAPEGQCR